MLTPLDGRADQPLPPNAGKHIPATAIYEGVSDNSGHRRRPPAELSWCRERDSNPHAVTCTAP